MKFGNSDVLRKMKQRYWNCLGIFLRKISIGLEVRMLERIFEEDQTTHQLTVFPGRIQGRGLSVKK